MAKSMIMHFELIDEYLLTGSPQKAQVVETLLADRSPVPGAAPFYEGMKMLGARTPDLTLVALRLVLAGKRADDANVVTLRSAAKEGRDAYQRALQTLALCVVALFLTNTAALAQASPTPNVYRSLESGEPAHRAAAIHGRIVKVDYPGDVFFVKTAGGIKRVNVVPTTTISSRAGYATFGDLKPGLHIEANVFEVGGRLVAQAIRI